MQGMKKYILQIKLTAIGFCKLTLGDFYKKSGYQIYKNQVKRILYKNEQGRLEKYPHADDDVVFYVEGPDNLLPDLKQKTEQLVYTSIPHW